MSLNLPILPLKIIDNLFKQKCLLPTKNLPLSVVPGAWAKCYVTDDQQHVLCRVYSHDLRDINQCCYMDDIVMHGNRPLVGDIMHRVEAVKLHRTQVDTMEVDFIITERIFAEHARKLTLPQLRIAARCFLQPLQLLRGCHVRTADLEKAGIAAIFIVGASGCDDNTAFRIGNETKLLVRDVKLKPVSARQPEGALPFCAVGFERAMCDLEELLALSKMHRRQKLRIPLNALILGAPGSGKSALIGKFLEDKQCNCFRIEASKVLGQYPGETESQLRKVFTAAILFEKQCSPKLPIVIVLEDLHLLCPAIRSKVANVENVMRCCSQLLTLVDELYKTQSNIICLASTCYPEQLNAAVRRTGRFEREISIDLPSKEQRSEFFKTLLSNSSLDLALKRQQSTELLDKVGKLTPGFVASDLVLLMHTVTRMSTSPESTELSNTVTEALKKTNPLSVRSTTVNVYKVEQGFEAIAGMQQLKRTLEVSILAGLKQQQAFQRFGLSLPKGVLFYGPPGCAKTSIAKCLAKEANMTFITTSAAEVYSPYVGCAEKFITNIFDTARKNAPCLIFLDEIDALASRRALSGSGSGSGDVQLRILSTLLTEMDGIVATANSQGDGNNSSTHILIVGATNRPDIIDDALLRPGRFDKLIHVPAPDKESRRAILALHADRMPFADNVQLDALAECTENYSGADICNLCNEAAMQAFQRDFEVREINAKDFEKALATLKSSLTMDQINWYKEFEEKKMIA